MTLYSLSQLTAILPKTPQLEQSIQNIQQLPLQCIKQQQSKQVAQLPLLLNAATIRDNQY